MEAPLQQAIAQRRSGTTHMPALHPTGRFGRVVQFAIIGVVCTVAFALLYSWFRTITGPIPANVAALSITMVFNFAANRWFTFGAVDGSLLADAAGYGVSYLIGMAASSAALWASLTVVREPSALVETVIAVGSGAAATVTRFVLLSAWVFRRAGGD